MKKNYMRIMPLIVAVAMVVGVMIGSFYANHFSGNRLAVITTGNNKINDLLHLINDKYVDSISINDIVEKAVPKLLKELDPHSTYISAKDADASMQELQGGFQGIGVQFAIHSDTVCILKIIKGGPSEYVGLKPGDRIVYVDDSLYVGKGVVTNDETLKRLKGEAGSTVNLKIKRKGEEELLSFVIERGNVPLRSIDAVYMLNDSTGYIRINNFAEQTYTEFVVALARLQSTNFQSLVIDLRGNVGGYMHPAVLIANEFLPKGRKIVYTEGRHSPREETYSDGMGLYTNIPLVVLVDEGSASASEILAGALQDNDRATVVGRRSFGKGLVQIPIEFKDGSMLRLTTARYYTPSGRCVQKPYGLGEENNKTYEYDLVERALHGEYFSADSIKTSGEAYQTYGGRTVYGGGGIIPDHFIPRDTLGMTTYLRELYATMVPHNFTFDFVDSHREQFEAIGSLPDLVKEVRKLRPVQLLVKYAEKEGIKRRNLMIRTSYSTIERYQMIQIIDQVLGTEAAVQFENQTDPAVLKAVELIQTGKGVVDLSKVEE
ncbi:MAG: S41 family peptidase [Bacteroidaceae bacterium]|nr:S41 family peptidase [Bacteroidaceae bacterium]